jgi:predicted Zn finger-like uncharacterized protein
MNLATRCPSCATVFRVALEQLRVSEGWVRCGRCNGVFNAAEVLFDIDSGNPVRVSIGGVDVDAPAAPDAQPLPGALPGAIPGARPGARPAAPPPSAAASVAPAPMPPRAFAPDDDLPPEPGPSTDARREPTFHDGAAPPPPASAGQHDLEPGLPDEPLLRAPSATVDDEITITDHPSPPPPPAEPAVPELADAPQAAAQPSFLRQAERAALWRRPAVRAGLLGAVALLSATLALQAALMWRDNLAAHVPAAEPLLAALCGPLGCSVQPLRRIDALAVDSSALNRLEGSTLYRLQMVLHNRSDTAVMMPALDLSLTDGQGRLVARRVLQVADLGLAQPVLAAGQELPIKALVSTGERRVDGYTLDLFYP